MGSKSRKSKTETDGEKSRRSAEAVETYRAAVACMARALVADMFEQHRQCALRDCRTGGRCIAYDHGGFCPMEMDNRQGCVLAGMTLFHDTFYAELFGPVPGVQAENAAA